MIIYDSKLMPNEAQYTVLLGVCTGINASGAARKTGNFPVYSFLCVKKDELRDRERRSVYECDCSDFYFHYAIQRLKIS